MPKPPSFAFDYERFESLLAKKTGLNKPLNFEAAGLKPSNYYNHRRQNPENKTIISPSVLKACQRLGFTLQEVRSLIIEL